MLDFVWVSIILVAAVAVVVALYMLSGLKKKGGDKK